MTLKALRVNAKMTQDDVAKELNMTRATYRKKENGKSEFMFRDIKKMAELFDVPLAEFESVTFF